MFYLSGLLVAFLSILFSIVHLRQSLTSYFDPVGFAVVIGGTVAVAVIVLPWEMHREIVAALKRLLGNERIDVKSINLECFEMIRRHQAGEPEFLPSSGSIVGQTLRDGKELMSLGFPREKIESILEERIFQWSERKAKVANSIRSLAKYPPAFGLVGTVLGLVSLMRAISDGASSSEAGFRMAVALVATLYGLLTANLVLNPAGENVLRSANEERKAAELALSAVLLAAEGATLLEAQETLNSHVAPESRIDLLGSIGAESETESEAAA
jgi:chemotaxis protein MotA